MILNNQLAQSISMNNKDSINISDRKLLVAERKVLYDVKT